MVDSSLFIFNSYFWWVWEFIGEENFCRLQFCLTWGNLISWFCSLADKRHLYWVCNIMHEHTWLHTKWIQIFMLYFLLYSLTWYWHIHSTFFKEFHNGLAQIVKFLLGKVQPSEAIFLSPKRGDSLDKFLEKIKENDLRFSITENYDAEIWKHHTEFMNGAVSWPSYQKDHCYPLLIRITVWTCTHIPSSAAHISGNIDSSLAESNFAGWAVL